MVFRDKRFAGRQGLVTYFDIVSMLINVASRL